MADQSRNIRVTWTGVDNVTAVAEQVAKSIRKYERKNSKALNSLTSAGKKATLTLGALGAVAVDATNAFGKMEGTTQGFARGFGREVTANLNTLRDATQGIVSDFELTKQASAAASLGVTNDIDEMAAIMQVARIRGREFGLSMDQSLESIVTGIGRMSPLVLDNLGIRIPDALKETFDSMNEVEKKQALVNAVLQDGANIAKQYGDIQLTTSERLQRVKASAENLRTTLGAALVPVMETVVDTIVPIVRYSTAWIQQNEKLVQNAVKLVAGISAVVIVAGALAKAVKIASATLSLLKASAISTQLAFGALGIAIVGVSLLLGRQVKKLTAVKDSSGGALDALKNLGTSGKKAAAKVGEGADEARKKIADLREQIEQENEAFEDQLANIVKNAQERLSTNKRTLKEEQKQFERTMQEKTEAYLQERKMIKEGGEEQIRELEAVVERRLREEKDLTAGQRQELQQRIVLAKAALQEQLNTADTTYQEETQSLKSEHQERQNSLQEKIAQDEAMLKKHAEDIKGIQLQTSKDEIDILKETHNKRLNELRNQIKKEESEFSSMNENISDMYSNTIADMNALDIDLGGALDLPSFGELLKGVGEDIENTVNGIAASINSFVSGAFSNLSSSLSNVLTNIKLPAFFDKLLMLPKGSINTAFKVWSGKLQDASTKASESSDWYATEAKKAFDALSTYDVGTPFVPSDQIAKIHKGEAVIPARNNPYDKRGQLKESGQTGNNSTFNNTFINTQVDPNQLASALDFQLRTLGRSR